MSGLAKLIYSVREGESREVPLLAGQETTIGRHPSCTLTISQPSVSRRHARLYFEAGGFYIEDLKSSNGSFVNNQRIQRSSLADGDSLRCGDFKFRYEDVEQEDEGTREQLAPSVPLLRSSARPGSSSAPRQSKPRVVGTLRPRRGPSDSPKSGGGAPPPLPSSATVEPLRPAAAAPQIEAASPFGSPSAAPSGGAPESETLQAELAAARAELSGAQEAAERLREDGQRVRQEVAEAQDAGRHAAQRVAELEAEALRASEQLKTLTDRSLLLRDQVQSQQGQLEEYRREKVALEVELSEVGATVQALQGAQNASGSRENELADAVNDLKREVRQKVKAYKDVERQLDLAEYNLRAAREENENLRLALGDDDSRRKDLNGTLADLQQVLQEKETIIDALQADTARLARELEQASAGVGAAERASIAGRQAVEQLNQLKRDNRQLRNTLSDLEAQSQSAPDRSQLEARLFAAERERDAAQSAQRDAESRYASKAAEIVQLRAAGPVQAAPVQAAPAPSQVAAGGLLEDAVSNYEALNDLASGLRMNVEVSVSLTQELRPLIEAVVAPGADLGQITAVAAQVEAVFTLESLEEELQNAEAGARASKKAMRRFREVLKARGYGS